jgi:diadenosine tetraphosphate (Ap4A) HIT family hydrolase
MALLSDDDRTSFFADVAKVAKAIHKVFNPDKINYGAYGDTGNHLHFHLVPKYKDQFEWATTFEMNPGKKFLTETEYKDIIKLIKDNL